MTEDTKKILMRIFLFVLAIMLGFILCAVIIEPFAIRLLEDKIIFGVQNLSIDDLKYLDKMIALNKIHTGDLAVERIIGFYQTLLATIIGIATFGGFIGFLYIKNSHKRDICEGIQGEINSEYGRFVIGKEISKFFNIERESGDLKLQSDNIEELDTRLEEVEKLANILSDSIDEIRNNRTSDERITLPTPEQ